MEKKTDLSFYLFTACNQFVNELRLPVLCFLDILFKLPDLYSVRKEDGTEYKKKARMG